MKDYEKELREEVEKQKLVRLLQLHGPTDPTSLRKHLKIVMLSIGPFRTHKEATMHIVLYPDLKPGLGTKLEWQKCVLRALVGD